MPVSVMILKLAAMVRLARGRTSEFESHWNQGFAVVLIDRDVRSELPAGGDEVLDRDARCDEPNPLLKQ